MRMVALAKLVKRMVVAHVIAGSSPAGHPSSVSNPTGKARYVEGAARAKALVALSYFA